MTADTDTVQFLRLAIGLAEENVLSGRGGPFGCVIVRGGKIIARGTNLVTSTNDPTAHAEVVAIRRACEALRSHQLDACSVYASCEPCPMCAGAILWARPARVFYAATKERAAASGFDDTSILEQLAGTTATRRLSFEQIAIDTADRPFALWDASDRKRAY